MGLCWEAQKHGYAREYISVWTETKALPDHVGGLNCTFVGGGEHLYACLYVHVHVGGGVSCEAHDEVLGAVQIV